LRGVPAILAAAFVVAMVGLAVVWSLGLVAPAQRIQFVPEKVFAAAYDALLSVHTVSYTVETEINRGICGVGFNVQLTEEEWNSVPPDERRQDRRGIVVSCPPGQQHYIEEGVYDMDRQAFHATMRAAPDDTGASPLPGFFGLERVYVDGRLYIREGDGAWREQPTSARWVPFSTADIGGVPSGGLDALKQTYDDVEDLGTDKLGGVEVRVFKASKTLALGFPQEVQVWVGTRDGLPRKAVLQITQPPSSTIQEIVDHLLERLRNDPEYTEPGGFGYQYKDDPIVVRGDDPTEKTMRWTYTFDRYNEPVDIQAPEVGDE
jgi:hypothetical protein